MGSGSPFLPFSLSSFLRPSPRNCLRSTCADWFKKYTRSVKKMGGHEWATNEQKKWLQDYYEEHYVHCLVNREYTQFKPIFFEAWFHKWPEIQSKECGFPPGSTPVSLTPIQRQTLARQIAKRQKQLLNAMRWKANTSREKRSTSAVDPFKSMNRLIKDSGKRTRSLSEEQVYSKLYYEGEIKPKYEEECARLGLDTTSKKERMTVRRRLTKEAWDESSKDEQLRREVLEEKARLEAERAIAEMSAPRSVVAPSPPDMNLRTKAVNDLPAMLVKLLDRFKDETGWAFTVLAGGPDYSKGDKIKTFSIHVGETPLGMNFTQAHHAYNEQIMQPFDAFVRHVHGKFGMPSTLCLLLLSILHSRLRGWFARPFHSPTAPTQFCIH
ncbi:hypothetical protein EV363DRAFT_1185740 [Boletus edulis]|nr:hypothetical protein EV363DRAFT_1185754 [Boletus edulis]KAF8121463.1 hypothetical protein EV363DRAFT_1185740 [Boletus edulis]